LAHDALGLVVVADERQDAQIRAECGTVLSIPVPLASLATVDGSLPFGESSLFCRTAMTARGRPGRLLA
jgi:hypothetical protein